MSSERSSEGFIGVRAAARMLGVHENTIRNWEKAGILRATKTRRFSLADVERMRGEMLRQFAPPTLMPEPREAVGLSDSVPRPLRRVATHGAVDAYVSQVVKDWEDHWRERADHRYGRDFQAFLGERILTDFNLRHHDRDVSR